MKKTLVLSVFFLCLASLPKAYALDGIEVFSGYLDGRLDDTKKDYQAVPLLVGLIFDLKPLTSKIGINPRKVDFIWTIHKYGDQPELQRWGVQFPV